MLADLKLAAKRVSEAKGDLPLEAEARRLEGHDVAASALDLLVGAREEQERAGVRAVRGELLLVPTSEDGAMTVNTVAAARGSSPTMDCTFSRVVPPSGATADPGRDPP